MTHSADRPAVGADHTKRSLRREFRKRRRVLDRATQRQHALDVAKHLATSPLLYKRCTVGVYLPSERDGELDTAAVLSRLWSRDFRVGLPVIGSAPGEMTFYRCDPGTPLVINRFSIHEPKPGTTYVNPLAMSLLFVPLVAFDNRGGRLGMGAGYYDRFIGRLPRLLRPRLVGLAHEAQRSDTCLPTGAWDVPLDDVITETGWQQFSRHQ